MKIIPGKARSASLVENFDGNEEINGESQTIWEQMKEIAAFAGPATGLWVCGPLMSLIDTMVIGQGSSLELAALGTVLPSSLHFSPSSLHFCISK